MSIILGLNTNHSDSSACLVVNGKLIGAISEERLGKRLKSTSDFPHNAIYKLMDNFGFNLNDLTHIAISRNSKANLFARFKYSITNPSVLNSSVKEYFRRQRSINQDSLVKLVSISLNTDPSTFSGKVIYVEHHLAHIASSYYLSNFDDTTLGFSYDASGDFVSLMLAECQGNKIKPIYRVHLPHSLGFFYSAICQHIGFDKFGEEYKVMGLAAYGNDIFQKEFEGIINFDNKNLFKLNTDFFRMHNGQKSGATNQKGEIIVDTLFKNKISTLLGEKRSRNQEILQHHMDLAASCQKHFERIVLKILKIQEKKFNTNNIAMAGGCALNGLVNSSIRENTKFYNQYIQPASSDDGTALGAAYWCWHNIENKGERFHMKHSYWGFDYKISVNELISNSNDFDIEEHCETSLMIKNVAKLLFEGAVVGWYQGRSEWGPRALGNRSILANPCIPNMKDILNKKIKRRESFRPFAPTIIEEDLSKYFHSKGPSNFMQHIVDVKYEWRKKFPAITHVDGTARIQTINESQNFKYYNLIREFSYLSGHPILLNTSFNENEPIVETPQQAFSCFKRTDMDILVLENIIIKKKIKNG